MPHQHRTQVGIAKSQRPELKTLLGDSTAGKRRHEDADLQHDRPKADGMAEILQLELGVGRKELTEIERGQVTCRIVEEHVFRARIGGIDTAIRRTGMPFVDGGVVLRTGIRANPGGPCDLIPEVPCLEGLGNFAIDPTLQLPIAIRL